MNICIYQSQGGAKGAKRKTIGSKEGGGGGWGGKGANVNAQAFAGGGASLVT